MSEKENVEENKPEPVKINAILRQELNNLTPKCDVKFAVICNLLLSLLFFIFGIPIVTSTNSIIEFKYDYTTAW